ncbi:hypothetical protein NC652_029973 [Populus alba x Populus x berolinensis]|nr:hypothetical protein NC652_029973 [Populus alba x Populus x berolinensis]
MSSCQTHATRLLEFAFPFT